MSSFLSRTSVWLVAWLSLGCSVVFVTPPPAAARGVARPHVDCTTSYLWPIVDTAFTAYQLAGVAYVSTLDESRFDRYPITKQQDLAIGGVFAAAYAGSAIYGYVSAARCRRIKRGPPTQDYIPGVSVEPTPVTAPRSARAGTRDRLPNIPQ